MRTPLATTLAFALTLLAGLAGAQTAPGDMGRAGAAARAAIAMQDGRMGAAAATIPRGASLPPMGASPEPQSPARSGAATGPATGAATATGALSAQAPMTGDGGTPAETGEGPRLMGGAPSAADARLHRGQCPAGTIRRNQGCVPLGRHAPAY